MTDSMLSKPLTRESVSRAITAIEARIERMQKVIDDPNGTTNRLLLEGLENDKKTLEEMRASLE